MKAWCKHQHQNKRKRRERRERKRRERKEGGRKGSSFHSPSRTVTTTGKLRKFTSVW